MTWSDGANLVAEEGVKILAPQKVEYKVGGRNRVALFRYYSI